MANSTVTKCSKWWQSNRQSCNL